MTSTLARLAAAVGYADQAHLVRDCRDLTDRTPSALRARPAQPQRASDCPNCSRRTVRRVARFWRNPVPEERIAVFLGLRTVIYPAPDLAQAKAWFSELLGTEPYFDQPFYVGFQVAGYELALDPNADAERGPITYWGVPDAAKALGQLKAAGAEPEGEVQNVGEGIRVATVRLPVSRAILGIIENPHFTLIDTPAVGVGAGR